MPKWIIGADRDNLIRAVVIAWEALTLAQEKHPGAKVVCKLALRRIAQLGDISQGGGK